MFLNEGRFAMHCDEAKELAVIGGELSEGGVA